jgi:hypothetical protein
MQNAGSAADRFYIGFTSRRVRSGVESVLGPNYGLNAIDCILEMR